MEQEQEVRQVRGTFFPLRRAFSRMVYGDLEAKFIEAAGRGDSWAIRQWVRRGANIDSAGGKAIKLAVAGQHNNTVGVLLRVGVSPKKLPPGSLPAEEYSISDFS